MLTKLRENRRHPENNQKEGPVSFATLQRRFFPNIGWAALIGFAVNIAAAFSTRFSSVGWYFLPFGVESPLGPLGNIVFDSCCVFVLLNVFCLLKSNEC